MLLRALLIFSLSSMAWAEHAKLTIIIDDLGYHLVNGMRSAKLPAPVTLAVIPHTRHSLSLAKAAHIRGKEVMLHLPMSNSLGTEMEPGTLTELMPKSEFKHILRTSLAAVPFIQGVNNHMGSKLTQQSQAMSWVMEELRDTPLYFVDSRTSSHSKAYEIAKSHAIPTLKRDVFLDNDRNPVAILAQLRKAIRKAKSKGFAVAIGHPYPETLAVLEQELPNLAQEGIELVPASALFEHPQSGHSHSQLMTRVVEFP